MADTENTGGFKRFVLWLIGVALIPLVCALALAVSDILPAVLSSRPPFMAPEPLAIVAGFALTALLFAVLPLWITVYVFGHELTHAIWGLLTGSKVGKIKVSDKGGYVNLSNPGIFTTLAPYFVPFYAVVVILLRLLVGIFADMTPYRIYWLFLIGMAYGFHVLYTVRSLMERQPDIREFGRTISYAIILSANILMFGYGIVLITGVTFWDYHSAIANRTVQCYSCVASTAAWAFAEAKSWVQKR